MHCQLRCESRDGACEARDLPVAAVINCHIERVQMRRVTWLRRSVGEVPAMIQYTQAHEHTHAHTFAPSCLYHAVRTFTRSDAPPIKSNCPQRVSNTTHRTICMHNIHMITASNNLSPSISQLSPQIARLCHCSLLSRSQRRRGRSISSSHRCRALGARLKLLARLQQVT